MTPFGAKLRALRTERGMTMKAMARQLELTPAYLSALEHGHRGRPSPGLVQQICAILGLIWDDADELRRLAELSHPRIVVDTSGLSPEATQLANRLAERIGALDRRTIERVLGLIEAKPTRKAAK
ncbi:MAG: helix-turn-helix domain-containing protein [Alphaproteobacteria bacterium]|nr:helix-turn-helix domain-containing protein [Alphaproteobacteria bacterium]